MRKFFLISLILLSVSLGAQNICNCSKLYVQLDKVWMPKLPLGVQDTIVSWTSDGLYKMPTSSLSLSQGIGDLTDGYTPDFDNVYLGVGSGVNTSVGNGNTGLGVNSLGLLNNGNSNVGIGWNAGLYYNGTFPLLAPQKSLFLGANTEPLQNSDTNEIVIGYNAVGLGSYSVVLGNDNIKTTALTGNVGINTKNPLSTLEVRQLTTNANDGIGLRRFDGGGTPWYLGNPGGANDFTLSYGSDVYFSYENAGNANFIEGNVGIGATPPLDKLQVEGAIRLTTPVGFIPNVARIYYDSNIGLALTGKASTVNDFTIMGSDGTDYISNPSGTDHVVFTGGNVGIGTATPLVGDDNTNLLDIGGSIQVNPAINPVMAMSGDDNSILSAQYQNRSTGVNASIRLIVASADKTYGAFTQPSSTNTGSFFGVPKGDGTFLFSSARILGIGTITNEPIVFGTGNNEKIRILGNGDVGIGTTTPDYKLQVDGDVVPEVDGVYELGKPLKVWQNLYVNTINNQAPVIGEQFIDYLGDARTDNLSVFLGNNSGALDDLANNFNTAVGVNTLSKNVFGSRNTAIGTNALKENTGSDNTAIGSGALIDNISGGGNIAIGPSTLNDNISGDLNVALLDGLSANVSGSQNLGILPGALGRSVDGDGNIAIGLSAALVDTNLNDVVSPNSCIYVGNQIKSATTNPLNEVVIGHEADGAGNNSITLGSLQNLKTIINGNTGINLVNPLHDLDVNGAINAHHYLQDGDTLGIESAYGSIEATAIGAGQPSSTTPTVLMGWTGNGIFKNTIPDYSANNIRFEADEGGAWVIDFNGSYNFSNAGDWVFELYVNDSPTGRLAKVSTTNQVNNKIVTLSLHGDFPAGSEVAIYHYRASGAGTLTVTDAFFGVVRIDEHYVSSVDIDNQMVIISNGNEEKAYAEIGAEESAATVTISVADTWYNITNGANDLLSIEDELNISLSGDTIFFNTFGIYDIDFSVSCSDGPNNEIQGSVFLYNNSDVEQDHLNRFYRKIGSSGDVGNASTSGKFTVGNNDWYCLPRILNETATDITIESIVIDVTKID